MNILKSEGHKFPELKESDVMFSSDTAPEWVDGEMCHGCRSGFTIRTRRHHCRNCGQVFCQKCSSKNSPIPKYGIEKRYVSVTLVILYFKNQHQRDHGLLTIVICLLNIWQVPWHSRVKNHLEKLNKSYRKKRNYN